MINIDQAVHTRAREFGEQAAASVRRDPREVGIDTAPKRFEASDDNLCRREVPATWAAPKWAASKTTFVLFSSISVVSPPIATSQGDRAASRAGDHDVVGVEGCA